MAASPWSRRHAHLPLAAVQFHPESILSVGGGHGLALIANAVALLTARAASPPLPLRGRPGRGESAGAMATTLDAPHPCPPRKGGAGEG